METLGDAAQLPDNPAPHIVEWLFDAGPLGREGSTLAWVDISAWQENIGIELEPWEGRLIRRLSGEYGHMRSKADKANCPAPYDPRTADEIEDRVSSQFAAFVKAVGRRG